MAAVVSEDAPKSSKQSRRVLIFTVKLITSQLQKNSSNIAVTKEALPSVVLAFPTCTYI